MKIQACRGEREVNDKDTVHIAGTRSCGTAHVLIDGSRHMNLCLEHYIEYKKLNDVEKEIEEITKLMDSPNNPISLEEEVALKDLDQSLKEVSHTLKSLGKALVKAGKQSYKYTKAVYESERAKQSGKED